MQRIATIFTKKEIKKEQSKLFMGLHANIRNETMQGSKCSNVRLNNTQNGLVNTKIQSNMMQGTSAVGKQ